MWRGGSRGRGLCLELNDMKKKNPWVAAILNLLLPGIGFAYLGTPSLVVSGITLFISGAAIETIYVRHTVGMASRPSYWVWSVVAALSLAVTAFVLTNMRNRSIQSEASLTNKVFRRISYRGSKDTKTLLRNWLVTVGYGNKESTVVVRLTVLIFWRQIERQTEPWKYRC